jgi:hypothetical protein
MTHPKYGQRFSCYQCGVKFFDLNKPKPLCPKCGADQKKAPKKASSKPKHIIPVEEIEETPDDEPPAEEDIGEFPIKAEEEEERFDPDHDHLSIEDIPEDDL